MAGWNTQDSTFVAVDCVNAGALTDFDIIPAPGAGLRIVVTAIECQANATTIVVFKAGAVQITRRNAFANSPLSAQDPAGIFVLPENTKFVINTNVASIFAGWVKYKVVAA